MNAVNSGPLLKIVASIWPSASTVVLRNLTYCTVGSRTSGGERVEAFAPGLGATAEDFKRITVRTSVARKTVTWFAEKGYEAQMQSFFGALKHSQPPAVTVRDGARATI